MKIRRSQAAVITGALLVAGVAAQASAAAPKPVCNLVVDPAGDANYLSVTSTPLPSEDGLDLLSGDIATNATTLTAVVRVKNLASANTAPLGRAFYVNFVVGATTYYIDATTSPLTGQTGSVGYAATTRQGLPGVVTVIFDNAKNEIRMSTPIASFSKDPIKPKTRISGINLLAQRLLVRVTLTTDQTDVGNSYKAGTPSCVKVGK